MGSTRVAVVTGSNKGIGYEVVRQLCEKFDGDVYLTSRSEERGLEAVKKLEKDGVHPKFHQLDIDDKASVEALKDFIKAEYGGLDVLVNNAAIAFSNDATEPFGHQAELTLRTNFWNTRQACKILFPLLKPHARVVNVSSAVGHLTMINGQEPAAGELRKILGDDNLQEDKLCELMTNYEELAKAGTHFEHGWPNSNYKVSKVGLSALTRIQQREFNSDSREDLIINHVHPGYVDTDMTNHKGPLPPSEGAKSSVFAALIPANASSPKGEFIWVDTSVVDWHTKPAGF